MTNAQARFAEYLDGLAEGPRAALTALAEAIATAAPDAERAISYGAPAFKLNGRPLAGFTASRAHLSYLPFSPAVIEKLAEELSGWATSKGAIRFTVDHPLPADVIRALVAARRAELEGQSVSATPLVRRTHQ